MTKAQDYTKAFNDMLGAIPTDFSAVQDAVRNSAILSEKLSRVALAAAEQSTEISSVWAKEALSALGSVAKAQDEPADYTKAATDFATASTETAAAKLTALAEVAKKAQAETIDLLLASGKDAAAKTTAAVQDAVKEATAKAAATAKKPAKNAA